MNRFRKAASCLVVLLALAFGCARQPAEKAGDKTAGKSDSPFDYPFVHTLTIEQERDKPYSDYKAFYLLTEDFEPTVESRADIVRMREVLRMATDLSTKYHVPWTHFIDANTFLPAYVADDAEVKRQCLEMIGDLRRMALGGDDCELHLHGALNPALAEQLRNQEKLHIPASVDDELPDYRLRKSFFFHSFYDGGAREIVASLVYGKRLLERAIYDDKTRVVAFRPGGWDHGSSEENTLLYFDAVARAGLLVNSGLATGRFHGADYRVGNDPGRNLASVEVGGRRVIEISPTTGPGGYVNPVLPNDLAKLAAMVNDSKPVIVSVYHLSALQGGDRQTEEGADAGVANQSEALEKHFQTVADLVEKRVLYPVTLRRLLEIIQAPTGARK